MVRVTTPAKSIAKLNGNKMSEKSVDFLKFKNGSKQQLLTINISV